MIDNRTVQHFLSVHGNYGKSLDGVFGPSSFAAAQDYLNSRGIVTKGWTLSRLRVGIDQAIMAHHGINPGKIIVVDGIPGPVYQYALELWQNAQRDQTPDDALVIHQKPVWPRQADVTRFYGEPGKNQATLESPYPLYLDWDLSKKISRFSIHEKCHDSALRVMHRVLEHYGLQTIHRLGLDQFGGCLNVRKMRGGTRLSMHSWGIAIDWDADRNPLRASNKTALLARPECSVFLDLWEEEGWISLGRERNFDWMHVQAARL